MYQISCNCFYLKWIASSQLFLLTVMARQLDKHTAGYITWKAGQSSSIHTMLVHDTEKGHCVSGIQVCCDFFNNYCTFVYFFLYTLKYWSLKQYKIVCIFLINNICICRTKYTIILIEGYLRFNMLHKVDIQYLMCNIDYHIVICYSANQEFIDTF